ncbi:MAG: CorA family divalent cation transporter [Candidatus Izemoplasmatales bacterium]
MILKKSLPPGTVFSTSDNDLSTEIRKIYYTKDKVSVNKPFSNSHLWVRINGLKDVQLIVNELASVNVDYLIIEDIFNLTQRSKIEEIENGFFAIVKTTTYKEQSFNHEYISIILKDNIVFTFDENANGILDNIEERLNLNTGQIRNNNSRFLFYSIIDTLIDSNIVFEYEISNLLSSWESKIITEKIENIDILHKIRKEVLLMKNNIYSIVGSIDLIDDIYKNPLVIDYKKYYQDLIDHLYRLNDKLNLDWENIKTLYDMHMNNINERTNSIVKILTIFSATFIPLSFLAGVFGMNFTHMEIFTNPNGFWIFLGACVSILGLMIGFFKYKKWI